jgi:flagellar protein FliL
MAEDIGDEGGGGRKKKRIVIVLVLLLLIGGGVVAFFFLQNSDSEPRQEPSRTDSGFTEEGGRVPAQEQQASALNPYYWEFRDPKGADGGDYIINLIDGRGFLRVRLVAEIEQKEENVIAYLNARRPLLDDMIITRLSKLNSEDARNSMKDESLRKQLLGQVNSIFTNEFLKGYSGKGNPVKRILITKIILN